MERWEAAPYSARNLPSDLRMHMRGGFACNAQVKLSSCPERGEPAALLRSLVA